MKARWLAAGLAIAGCVAAPPTRPGGPRVGDESPRPAQPPVSAPEASLPGDATGALIAQSRAERAAGSHDRAAASLERALSIDPTRADLWLELGEVELEAGDREQAITLAQKALSLAGGDAAIERRAAELMARAR
jgi:tetratricopeptide (TPR) repeat protein